MRHFSRSGRIPPPSYDLKVRRGPGRDDLLPRPRAPLRFLPRALREEDVDLRVHPRPRRLVRAEPGKDFEPAEGGQLMKDVLDISLRQFPHRSVAALNVPARDYVALSREDVSGDGGESVVIVRESEYRLVEGEGVRQ